MIDSKGNIIEGKHKADGKKQGFCVTFNGED